MDRRLFLAASLGTLAAPRALAQTAPITKWKVTTSEGLDAIAFLGPLSGEPLYQTYYAGDARAFPLPDPVRAEIAALWKEAGTSGFGLLGPVLSSKISDAGVDTLDGVIAALSDPESRIRPSLEKTAYWDEADWKWLVSAAPRMVAVFTAMRAVGFPAFRAARTTGLEARATELQRSLAGADVIHWQRRLTGRDFDPEIRIILLQFAKPHGIKVIGQTFLQSPEYGVPTTVRIAAHEMLHPPIPMDGPVARATLAVLAKDPLIPRIVRDHDPKWGYTSLDGYLNEDLCQALDQLISEKIGVARNPADRWRDNDDGIHVLAAGLYGLLRHDRWGDTGGSIEAWLDRATRTGRLSPSMLHSTAARVLERPMDRIWPL